MREPDDTHEDGTAIYDHGTFDGPAMLGYEIERGELRLPCWIRIGPTSLKVNDGEAARHFSRGLLAAAIMAEENQ